MYLRKNFNKKTGIYRTRDSIEHFQFRVHLKRLHSLIKVPHLQLTDNTEPIDNNDPDEIESHTMRWQEKRLSRTEIEQYSEPDMCKTDIQKEYLLKIREHNLNGATKKPDKIFTYTTDDCWQPNNTDVQAKSDRTSKMVDANVDRMYIMADLQEETILFTIKWQSNGLLTVYPDFNDLAKDPYLIEIDADSRHIYQYAIEIVSQTELKEDDGAAAHVDGQLNVMAKRLAELSTKTLFDSPPRRCTHAYLFFEIKSAEYFEYDNIHVRYRISIPSGCTIINDGYALPLQKIGDCTEGSTHSSLKCHTDGVWKFGHCHNLNVLCGDGYRFDDFLRVDYEIISIDGWGRERTEGYTSQRIPFEAGAVSQKLPCYRDLGPNTIVERLERYFIGGRRKFELDHFNGISVEPCSQLNRYGNQTKSTGYLCVTNQIVVQRDVNVFNNKQSTGSRIEINKNRITIDDVVRAYQKAKRRLEDATQR